MNAVAAQAGIVSISTGDVLVGDRGSNLITNGSFENGHPGGGNVGWTPGSHIGGYPGSEVAAISGWTSSYDSDGAYGWWGPLGFQGGTIPDGSNAVYFGNSFASVDLAPVVGANGHVTFGGDPVFTHASGLDPISLGQTVGGLGVGDSYVLDFWVSGESNTGGFSGFGLFGLEIGTELTYLLLPASSNSFGAEQRYQIEFTADAASLDISFINWGHISNVNGSGSELVLDDVILNRAQAAVPEPLTGSLLLAAGLGLLGMRRRVS
ncbi:MAG: PEP-CTERM sorting domain-containing protein [Pseudomonadota bacterium]|nr:PEP-CTERM sorting domain-containing protein [Pseudomonadota bacterium]